VSASASPPTLKADLRPQGLAIHRTGWPHHSHGTVHPRALWRAGMCHHVRRTEAAGGCAQSVLIRLVSFWRLYMSCICNMRACCIPNLLTNQACPCPGILQEPTGAPPSRPIPSCIAKTLLRYLPCQVPYCPCCSLGRSRSILVGGDQDLWMLVRPCIPRIPILGPLRPTCSARVTRNAEVCGRCRVMKSDRSAIECQAGG
jgi:hypothetical protein